MPLPYLSVSLVPNRTESKKSMFAPTGMFGYYWLAMLQYSTLTTDTAATATSAAAAAATAALL